MESVKMLIQSLAGEDITEDNLSKLTMLTESLQKELFAIRKARVMAPAGISVVLPEGFGVEEKVAEKAIEPVEQKIEVEKPAIKVTHFGVPRPPSTVKVAEEKTVAPEIEIIQPLTMAENTETTEYQLNTSIVNELSLNNATVTAGDNTLAETEEEAAKTTQQEISLSVENHEVEEDINLFSSEEFVLEEVEMEEEEEKVFHFEPDAETQQTNTADEAEIETILSPAITAIEEPTHSTAQVKDDHKHYVPASLRIDGLNDIMVINKPQPKKETVVQEVPSTKSGELNDRLSTRQRELAEALQEPTIQDLKRGISINDRYQYIQNLFRGDESMFDRSIKTLNSFDILPEAQYWMQRELVVKLGWNDEDELVQQFYQLISRRFR